MKFAAIDVGSNAVRLLLSIVSEESREPIFEKVSLFRMPIRLGDDAFARGKISEEKIQHLVNTLTGFRYLMDAYSPLDYMACATSAMREAENRDEIVQRIKNSSGIDLDIIDGSKEAEIIYSNRIEKFLDGGKAYLYIDVGGGSTEITLFDNKKIIDSNSFNIGTIRLLEGLVSKNEWKEMKNWIKDVTADYQQISAVGSGGNMNKLFDLANKKYGKPLKYKKLMKVYDYLSNFTYEERIIQLGLKPDRADVILPASKIYLSAMKWGDISKIYVPKSGLADGMIHVLYKKHKKYYV
ncbi:MAG: exopolyphosphatase [Methanohalobium sp.]|uniref:Ppx/GppA phosphatase family protein n=1 Tax=Methanohalobium sp. TaxID=2837493 RepID=UPI00397D569F